MSGEVVEVTLSYHVATGKVALTFGPMDPAEVVRVLHYVDTHSDEFKERVLDHLTDVLTRGEDSL